MRAFVAAMAMLLAISLFPALASAQNISVLNVERTGEVPQDAGEFDIGLKGCENDDQFTFPYSITGTLTDIDTLEVWVGEGSVACNTIGARDGSTGTQCELVHTTASPAQNDEVVIGALAIGGGMPSVGDACDDGSVNTEPRDAKIWFLLVRDPGMDVAVEDYTTFEEINVDLLAPPLPTDLVLKQVDGGFVVEFTAPTDLGDVDGYNAYCDPPGAGLPSTVATTVGVGGGAATTTATVGAGGAGGAGVGGASTTGGGSSDCSSGILTEGAPHPANIACGSANGSASTSVTVTGLENGTDYAVALTSRDVVGNESLLTALVCGAPIPVDDFFTVYRAAGGTGGGGCTVAGGLPLAPPLAVGALLVVAGLLRLRRARARRTGKGSSVGGKVLLLAVIVATPAIARADHGLPDTDWRQSSRPSQTKPADTQFSGEIRFGPYWAAVDDEPGLTGTPYEDTFGTDPRFYFGLEFDWMPLRIPYVGMIGPGFGWGFTEATANSRIANCSGSDADCESEDETSLTIMPMHLSVVLRGDALIRETQVPLVPYAKFGPSVGVWSAGKSSGDSKVVVDGEDVSGDGATWGLNLALGLGLALNWLDSGASGRLHESTGIGHVYLFGEWMHAALTGLGAGNQMYVGTSTFVCGLSADF